MQQKFLNIAGPQYTAFTPNTIMQTKQKETPVEKTAENSQTNVKIPLSSYIANNNIHFKKRPEELEEFDISKLPQTKIDEEFAPDECVGSYNISCITNLASQFMTEQIRHIEQTGEIIPYKKENIIAENKGCSEEEIQEKLDEAKEEFLDYFDREKQTAINEINKVSPTTQDHTVYRIINNFSGDSDKYFEKINSLKEGDETTLDSAPLYVGTAPAGLMKAYGSAHDGVLFQIKLPKGSKLAKFPSYDGINQLLMKPDSKFKVIENKEYKDNFRLINLEYIEE